MESSRDVLLAALRMRLETLTAHPGALADVVARVAAESADDQGEKDRAVLVDLLVDIGWLDEDQGSRLEDLVGTGRLERNGSAEPRGTLSETVLVSEEPLVQPVEAEPPVALPDALIRYALRAVHGVGGLGRVHRAKDRVLRREVALKEIRPSLSHDPDTRRRLLREVQITAQLEHPGIVPVYDLAERDGAPVYTMRLVRGQTLRSAIVAYHTGGGGKDPLALPRLLGIFVNVCNAIAYAHARGVIHRDLKPDNVVLGRFGEVVLLDWGLAKLAVEGVAPDAAHDAVDERRTEPTPTGPSSDSVREQPEQRRGPDPGFVQLTQDARLEDTGAGFAMGTPAYMAPEQALGDLTSLGPRTDVYGLGAILFEILAGQGPHQGEETDAVLARIAKGPTPRARTFAPKAPRALDAVCARAMAKRPENRYGSASSLAEDVQRFLADEPVSVYREPTTQRVGRWMRKNRSRTTAAAVALLAIIGVTSVASLQLARMASRERQSRIDTAHVAVGFAARTVASEMDRRWRTLELAAADTELRDGLESRAGGSGVELVAEALQDWIERRHRGDGGPLVSRSWFVTDAAGNHLARSPAAPELVGRSFAFRDYFHGLGRDFEEGRTFQPIRDVHRSVVFRSKAAGAPLMVAFSIPVFGRLGEVLGVLAMTVEIGQFGALDLDVDESMVVVLVDTKPDWVGGRAHTGLVLHHPVYTAADPPADALRLPPERVEALRALRELRMEPAPPTTSGWPAGSFEPFYEDPAGGAAYGGAWLAAFEPVLVQGRATGVRDTGWVVIVQERPDAN